MFLYWCIHLDLRKICNYLATVPIPLVFLLVCKHYTLHTIELSLCWRRISHIYTDCTQDWSQVRGVAGQYRELLTHPQPHLHHIPILSEQWAVHLSISACQYLFYLSLSEQLNAPRVLLYCTLHGIVTGQACRQSCTPHACPDQDTTACLSRLDKTSKSLSCSPAT